MIATNTMLTELDLPNLADVLEDSGMFRVTRKYIKPSHYNLDDGTEKRVGIFLDTETTGLDHETDKIIELGMVSFTFSRDGRIFHLVDEYDEFEDPEIPIPEIITELTGITDDDVRGQKICDEKVEKIVNMADLVIAHNAAFDRPFVEKRFPAFKEKPWACSMREVPWREEGVESTKLEYLAYRCGFFYEGHRAAMDCLAGIDILAGKLPNSGDLSFKKLLESTRQSTYRIWASDTPFHKNTLLKRRGYRWNKDGKSGAWYVDTTQDKVEEEKNFLKTEIYGRDSELQVDVFNAFRRYSAKY